MRYERAAKWLVAAMFAGPVVFLFGGWINNSAIMVLGVGALFAVPFVDIAVSVIDDTRAAMRRRAWRAAERETPPPR